MEIERKWLINSMPDLNCFINKQVFLVTQTYTRNGIRLRIINHPPHGRPTKFYMTVKSDGLMVRNEWEVEIPEWVYKQLIKKEMSDQKSIQKVITKAPYDGLTIEFHRFLRQLGGLILIECEFPDEETARNFELPSWLREQCGGIIDVTDDTRYQNFNLFIVGRIPTTDINMSELDKYGRQEVKPYGKNKGPWPVNEDLITGKEQ